MGTTWSLRFDNPSMLALEAVREAVQRVLDRVIAQMSTWEPESVLSRFNRAAPGSRQLLDTEFATVLAAALDWAAASGGALDPTVGALVGLWGFGADAADADPGDVHPPSASELAEARARVGWQRLAFDRESRMLLQPGGARLDLSGIAKGYAVDAVADAVAALGIEAALVEIGGELRALGRRPDGLPWQVLVEGAAAPGHRITLAQMAIATTGDRWHRRTHTGRSWSHTLDPRRGEPTAHALASVTVLHPRCMHADALATVLMVLGPEEGMAFARRHGIAALLQCRDGGHRGDGGDGCDAGEGSWRLLASPSWPGAAAPP